MSQKGKTDIIPVLVESTSGKQTQTSALDCDVGNSGEGKVTGVGDPPCLGVKEGFHEGRTFQLRFEE